MNRKSKQMIDFLEQEEQEACQKSKYPTKTCKEAPTRFPKILIVIKK